MSFSDTSSASHSLSINATKVVPQNKNKNSKINKINNTKFKIKTDLDKLRKSKQFRELGDAFDYFSD